MREGVREQREQTIVDGARAQGQSLWGLHKVVSRLAVVNQQCTYKQSRPARRAQEDEERGCARVKSIDST
jgi:hypothetical protein